MYALLILLFCCADRCNSSELRPNTTPTRVWLITYQTSLQLSYASTKTCESTAPTQRTVLAPSPVKRAASITSQWLQSSLKIVSMEDLCNTRHHVGSQGIIQVLVGIILLIMNRFTVSDPVDSLILPSMAFQKKVVRSNHFHLLAGKTHVTTIVKLITFLIIFEMLTVDTFSSRYIILTLYAYIDIHANK